MKYIEQVYSGFNPDTRIRHIKENDEDTYYHTVKYKLKNNQREEIEVIISEEQYNRIYDTIDKKPVRKNRYLVEISNGLMAEIDEFKDTGDIVVEVEFPDEETMNNFIKPDWFGSEIKEKKSFNVYVFSKINRMVGDSMASLLISENMGQALDILLGRFFQANRILDRISAELSVKFVMPNTSNIVHKFWAHEMPLIADLISEYCDSRNYASNYPETTKDYSQYENLTEIFNKALDFMLEIEDETMNCISLAMDEKDYMTKAFLEKFLLEKINPFTKLAQNFVDYVEKNGDEPSKHMSIDARINRFLGIDLNSADSD